ncbi:Bestrophin, RFP-TM, chloride channel-domain-containing protein [Dichomitus squalens]|uniref:Bestrophin, RFP-TM, chloride channel-domain-containing protein n=1 Tax=Dichomitus squalens TaxID=114155 RepID=A0A4Q9PQ06_9APHY|nr:Bestrophin, RFP-TM, chloride channel-domain-containing protein [Dichomitus squalens]TBU56430.1 Bestrophin, RFP-TM, chloride channel-domain-containing protein [Dichomitus squalens]
MVAHNPLFASWSLRKFKATVINDIWPEVLFFSGVAAMVSLVSDLTSHKLSFSSAMLTVLGTVLGLVISFRTSSAYERYMEGRKLWTAIALASRNIAQVIWIHVPFERIDKKTGQRRSNLEVVIEKKSMINLVQAYAVSVKHLLRGEAGVYYEDLYPLVCFLPRYASHAPENASEEDMLPMWRASAMDAQKHRAAHTLTSSRPLSRSGTANEGSPEPEKELGQISEDQIYHSLRGRSREALKKARKFDPEMALPVVYSEHPLQPARNPPKESIFDYLPFLRVFKILVAPFRRSKPKPELPTSASAATRSFTGKRLRPEAVDSNVPLEITLFLSNYLAWLLKNGQLQPALASAFVTAISSLQDTVTNLDRIRNTPLPFAYQAHLRISLWIYLFFLPFQVWSSFGYLTIPGTAFASFLLLGFLEIGQEIENPFNYDLNDLDLDSFCLQIQRELHEITAHSCPDPDEFLFTAWNQPFAPGDRRTAEEMMNDVNHSYHGPDTGMHSIRRTLLKSWWDVDEITRQK